MTYILMDRFTMEILGCGMIGDYLSKVDINTRSRWLTSQIFLKVAEQWVREGERSVDNKYLSSNGVTPDL
jgi:hypothetical protein